ncbi:transposase, partial [Lentilactobacillus hilgardii]|uniref:transposase n=1 Tax=Lentilactobacillus hilgardii TaxID=1588 RepID=UPI001CC1D314
MAKLHFRPYITNQTVLFPQRIDENIAATDPVRIVNAVIDNLNLESFKKLYKETGRCPYHPKMMLKVIIYAYMNNIYSCRKIEKHLLRDIHYIWLAGNEHPDFITINRFRNRVKEEINNVFTQLVLVLADKGFISLDVEYIDGTKIESKANKYTCVWRKTVERNRTRLMDRFMQENGIEAFIKYNYFHKEQRPRYTPNPFHAESRQYTAQEDYYVCPMGQHMNRIGTKRDKTASGYITESARYKAKRCEGCPLRGSCFKSLGNCT